ncbi:NAD(P)H-dependent flavin oxidoreductase [Roseococcus sp. DSY-14]|uniref:NAD(P)H-dependent flavin oxidoreductase n=1 Tax=Roseococcus sp. DSY-14 TaxID=3369650 RepID=UPI00387B6F79
MIRTRVTEMLGLDWPIVQGGLARVAGPALCAAVSAAGALGQLSTVGLDAAALRAAIRQVRAATPRPFGVNFPLGRTDVTPLLEVALEEGVAVIALTAGNPAPWIRRINGAARTLVLIAGPELARKAEGAGADLVATVGFEGGGHIGRGEETTLVMVPRVVRAVSIPVLASGGIADGHGLAAALALGAEGVEMGTRFVATQEAQAHDAYKRALLEAAPEDTMLIKRSIGQPGRVLRSPHAEAIVAAEARQNIAAEAAGGELLPLIAGEANARGVEAGALDEAYVWAGQCVGLISDLPPAGAVVRRMGEEARSILGGLAARL